MSIARCGERSRRFAIAMPKPIPTGVVALLDDDASLLQALERALVAYGYRVKAFSSVEQYLDEAIASELLCAVLDIHIHGAPTGLDLGYEISHAEKPTPIVFMTASHDMALRERAMEIGCVDFLEKPFLTTRLIGAIMKLEGRDPAIRV